MVPRALPASTSVRHSFVEHAPDGAVGHAVLLDLIAQLELQLHQRGQVARGLTLSLRFVGDTWCETWWEKIRHLPEASAHDDDLRTMAYRLIDAASLQRGCRCCCTSDSRSAAISCSIDQ
ncbi:hypothetical protein [Streptomyces sp. NPDC017991]|uniref:DinB/UmuC family translesion DNA polymerase n=1 Tax=Streptomyces sp. NPDC017991 TaxID=3365026 RepID=UPI0037A0C45B